MPSYNLGSVEGEVKINYDGSGIRSAGSDIDRLLGTMTREQFVVRVTADIAQVRSGLDQAREELARLQSQPATIQTRVEINAARANIDQLESELARLEAQRVEVEVRADTTQAENDLSGFAARALVGGVAAGAALSSGLSGAINIEAGSANLQAQLGLTTQEADRAGKLAGDLYANNFGGSMEEVNSALIGVQSNIGDLSSFSDAELSSMSQAALGLASTFNVDVNEATRAAGQLIKTGLAANATEAFDIITAGFQNGANASGDLLETIGEYSVQFEKLGIGGGTAMAYLSQGLQAGARDGDLVADAFKEFSIRAVDGSKEAAASFEALGFNAQDMQAKFAAGGPVAEQAFGQVITALKSTQGQADAATIAFGLFGTQSEDMGAALYALDPAAAAAAGSAAEVAGRVEEMNRVTGETAAAKLETARRGFETLTTSMMAMDGPVGIVVSGMSAVGPEVLTAGAAMVQLGFIAGPALLSVVTSLWGVVSAAAASTANVVISAATQIASWIAMAAVAVANAAIIAAAWLAANPIALIAIAIAAIVALIIMNWDSIVAFLTGVWEWIKTTAADTWNNVLSFLQTVLGAIAAFFTTIWNGIISFLTGAWNNITTAVNTGITNASNFVNTGLQAISNFFTNIWNNILSFLRDTWNNITSTVNTAINNVSNFINTVLTNIGNFFRTGWNNILSFVRDAWNNIVNAVTSGGGNVLNIMRNLPGQILGAVGNLGSLLFNAGRDIVIGMWNGIVGMGSWLYGQIMSWIRSVVPGPILSFLGIASPSKWMKDEVGKMIPAGIAVGIEAASSVAEGAARHLAERVAAASSPKLGAAREVLEAMNAQTKVYEDFSFKGMSDNAKAFNDSLSDMFYVKGQQFNPAAMKKFLQDYIANNELPIVPAKTTAALAPYATSTTNTSGIPTAAAANASAATTAAATGPRIINIGTLALSVEGNLDPTDPVRWRAAMEAIREGITSVEASYR